MLHATVALAALTFGMPPGTATAQTASAATPACGKPVTSLPIPPGMSIDRMALLKSGKHFNVYSEVEAFDDSKPDAGHMPAAVRGVHDVSPSGMNRLLADTIQASRRFKWFDMRPNATAEHGDVLVKAKVVYANQALRPMLEGGRQQSESRVVLSVQLMNMLTGESMLPADVNVEGRTGLVTGDRVVLAAAESPDTPAIKRRLADDFYNAMRRAFAMAGERIEALLRPITYVIDADMAGCSVSLFGGSRFGLQPGDEMVVFRVEVKRFGEQDRLVRPTAVARVTCETVGVDDTACQITQLVPGQTPREGDFAIITDASLARTRAR